MRKLILAAALVGVAVPALAQDREVWAERRAERGQQQRQAPPAEQGNEQARPERPRFEHRVEQPRVEQPRVEQFRVEQQRADQPGSEQPRAEQQQVPQRAERPRIDSRQARWGSDGQQRNGQREGHQWTGRSRDAQQPGSRPSTSQPPAVQQPGGQQWTGQQRDNQRWASRPAEHRWSSDWQRDSRYDWRRYRERNRSVFRVGSYYDPFGRGYRPVSVGFTLYAGYYSADYWLDDPWHYRLPPVYGPYRWVRYYDDAVLVDLYSGRVVEVIRNFFW